MDRKHMVFLKVAELGNLTAASAALHVAQPSVTRTINAMESDFETRLFTRQPRGMELTEEGRTLYRYLKEMEVIYERARRDVDAVRRGYHDAIRIGCGLTYQLLLMPEILCRLWQDFPHTSFQVFTGAADDHARALRDGELDIVITAAIEKIEDPLIEVIKLSRIEHGVASWPGVLPDIPLTERMPLNELENRSWVLFQVEPELTYSMESLFHSCRLAPPRVALTTTSLQLGLEIVSTNSMIMSAPTLLRGWLRQRGYRLHATSEPLWELDSGIALLKANRDHPVATALIAHAKELVQSLPEFATSAA